MNGINDERGSIIVKILDSIRGKMDSLTPRQKILGDYVLQNYEQLAFTPINDFAKDAGVSQATIVRFCYALGYKGYLQFSKELQQAIQARLSGVNRFQLAQKRKKKKNSASVFENVIFQELDNVADLTKHVNKSDFYKCMELMQNADRICIIGCLGSSSLAIHLGQMLSKIISRVDVLNTTDLMAAAALKKLTPRSLTFIIAFPRYPKLTLQLGQSAAKSGSHVVCLTNTPPGSRNPTFGNSLYYPRRNALFRGFLYRPDRLYHSPLRRVQRTESKIYQPGLAQVRRVCAGDGNICQTPDLNLLWEPSRLLAAR